MSASVGGKTKIVLRRLPAGLKEETLYGVADATGIPCESRYFVAGSVGTTAAAKRPTPARAYFCFSRAADAVAFGAKMHGYAFIDSHGAETRAAAEFAPNQRRAPPPQTAQSRRDRRENTLAKDPHFLAFAESLARPRAPPPSAEALLETRRSEEAARVAAQRRTPLLESLLAARSGRSQQSQLQLQKPAMSKRAARRAAKRAAAQQETQPQQQQQQRKRGKRAGQSTRERVLKRLEQREREKREGAAGRAKMPDADGFVAVAQTAKRQQQASKKKELKRAAAVATAVAAAEALNEPSPAIAIARRPPPSQPAAATASPKPAGGRFSVQRKQSPSAPQAAPSPAPLLAAAPPSQQQQPASGRGRFKVVRRPQQQ